MSYSKEVFLDEKISLKAKGLFAVVLQSGIEENFNIKMFTEQVKEGKSSVQSAINELIEHGYCKRRKVKDWEGRFAGYEYRFDRTKIQS